MRPPKNYDDLVIIVDDDEHNIELMTEFFSEKQNIKTFQKPIEALQFLNNLKDQNIEPSVILSDIKMPEMNGIQFLSKCKTLSDDSIRILITGFSEVESLISAINSCNIYKYLLKPVSMDSLEIELKNSIEHFNLVKKNKFLLNKLKKYNSKLKSEVDIKTEEISSLLRILCHDITNPLAVIDGFTRILKKKYPSEAIIDKISHNSENIFKLLDLVKNLHSIDSGKKEIEVESVNIERLLDDIKNDFEYPLINKKIELEIVANNINKEILSNDTILRGTIFSNLLSNAIKFSNRNTKITIEVNQMEEYTEFFIKDEGTGIAEIKLKTIFLPNYKTTELGTEGEKGTGFGMPLVKKYVEKLDGKIHLKSSTKTPIEKNYKTIFKLTFSNYQSVKLRKVV